MSQRGKLGYWIPGGCLGRGCRSRAYSGTTLQHLAEFLILRFVTTRLEREQLPV